MKEMLRDSVARLEKWVEDHDYKAYEPFDGLSSPLRFLTFGNLFLNRLLLQLIRQSPVNLRPLLGVKPLESTKGRGYMASGYLAMFKSTGDPAYKEKAKKCLDWLADNKAPGYRNFSWANHFDFAARGGLYSKHEPIIVWTALIGQAFLDAYEVLGEGRYLEIARSVCEWIMELPKEETDKGTCISYIATRRSSIHNSNMLGAAMLARTGRMIRNEKYLNVAREAMVYSCSRQLPDGAWYYSEAQNHRWIDNFHTGYNLDSLKIYMESSGDEEFRENLIKGFDFYKNTFFEDSGRPKYYHNRTYPVDSQCMSQSIETLCNFSDLDRSALALCCRVARWAVENMQDRDGHFYYRQYPIVKAKTPMFHWAQATTYKAMARLLASL
jgi:rhamnogalacturonyl hydrolase YesR